MGAHAGGRRPRTAANFLGGATSGCVSTLLLQPLDVVKTRMQMSAAFNRSVHLRPALAIASNTGVAETVRAIVRQDSVFGLWRGVVPTLVRNMLGVGLYFVTLQDLRARLAAPDGTLSDGATLAVGAAARSFACCLLCPLSVVKTRMETVEYSRMYSGAADAMRTIARREGYRGLFSGLAPAILRDAPYSALYMLIYLRTQAAFGRAFGIPGRRPIPSGASDGVRVAGDDERPPAKSLVMGVNFASGAVGGGIATILTQPQDVVKTRMQLSQQSLAPEDASSGAGKRYGSVIKAATRIFNEEGIYGFFRGSSPRFLKRMLGSAISWMIFEEIVGVYERILGSKQGAQSIQAVAADSEKQ